jgi:hypothetical protein
VNKSPGYQIEKKKKFGIPYYSWWGRSKILLLERKGWSFTYRRAKWKAENVYNGRNVF